MSMMSCCRGRSADAFWARSFALKLWLVGFAARTFCRVFRLFQFIEFFFGRSARCQCRLVSRSFAIWTCRWWLRRGCLQLDGSLHVSWNRLTVVCSRRAGRHRWPEPASLSFGAHHSSLQGKRRNNESDAAELRKRFRCGVRPQRSDDWARKTLLNRDEICLLIVVVDLSRGAIRSRCDQCASKQIVKVVQGVAEKIRFGAKASVSARAR